MHKPVVTLVVLATLMSSLLGGCELLSGANPAAEEGNPASGGGAHDWLEAFSVDRPGGVVAENTSEEKIAVFEGEVSEQRLVGILDGFERDYRLEEMSEGTVVLQAVRYEELAESIEEPDRVEVVSSELISVTGGSQTISLSGGVTGDAELAVRNETERLVEVRSESAEGEVLFVMDAGERRSVYLSEGPVVMFPVAIVPVYDGGQIRSHRALELAESAMQLELSTASRENYTIVAQETGTDVHAYVRVHNEYGNGLELLRGSETVQTTLSERFVNPGRTGEYAFALDQDGGERTTSSLSLRAYHDDFPLGEITLKRGYIVEITVDTSGAVTVANPRAYDPE